jgi:O-antigen ligase
MPTGTHANEVHSDITNHYLQMGVMGGLPLMLVFILVVVAAFRAVGRVLREKNATTQDHFLAWTLGAILFGYVINFFSISLFDESDVFFYLVLGGIGAMQATKWTARGSHDNQPAEGHARSVGVIPNVSVACKGKSYL